MDTSGTDPVTIISLTLSQEDTLSFKNGEAEIQVRWLDGETAYATRTAPVKVNKVLLERVIGGGTA